jgi:hypothetical protein
MIKDINKAGTERTYLKSVVFLYTNSKHSEKEIGKAILLILSTKKYRGKK